MLSLSFFIFYALISDATPFILTPAINVDQQWKLVQKLIFVLMNHLLIDLRREDGSEAYWNRTWNEYKEGFGSEDVRLIYNNH